MLKPICIKHMKEMTVTVTGANVHYPLAQYIYNGDIWICPVDDCDNEIFLRAFTPAIEGFHPEYQGRRELALQMWDL